MIRFVLDASVALAWFVDNPVSAYAVQVKASLLRGARALVPGLWHLEMANGFAVAERRGILSAADASRGMSHVENLLAEAIESSADFVSMRQALTTALHLDFRPTTQFTSTLRAVKGCLLPLSTSDCSPPHVRLGLNYLSNRDHLTPEHYDGLGGQSLERPSNKFTVFSARLTPSWIAILCNFPVPYPSHSETPA